MSATQTLPLYQSNESPDWALIENIDQRQLAETHLAPGEPASACRLSRGSSSLGTDNGALSVAAGSVAVGGETFDIAEQPVDIPYGDDEPRRDVIYVDGDGDVQVRLGQPAPFVWADELAATSQTLNNAYRPAPPDLVSTSGFVLGVVTVEANAASLPAQDCIHDLRIGPPVATPAEGSIDRPYVELSAGMDESEVRTAINTAADGTTFWVEPGASWTVTDQLVFPDECVHYGNTPLRGQTPTYNKGFNGDLASLGRYSSFHNTAFHGQRGQGYSGHVAVVGQFGNRTTRNTTFHQCNFLGAAGDGWHGGMYFATFTNCMFQNNGGWGVWLPDEENPHNQWLGPCYIADNDAGGVYQASYGRNQQCLAWIGNNGGPGMEFADPANKGGFVGLAFRGTLAANDGPGYLVTGGTQRNHRILDTQIAQNASAPAGGLTGPVGHVHVEGGTLAAKIEGGQSYGHSQLVNATDTDSIVVLDSPHTSHSGDVTGTNLDYALFGPPDAVDGSVDVEQFARYGAGGAEVDEVSVMNTLTRIYASSTGQSVPDSTFTQIEFDATTTDSLSAADLAGDAVTISADGTYSLVANVRLMAVPSGSRVIARIDAGGTEVARADSHAAVSGGDALTARVSDTRALAANDSVMAQVWQDTGGPMDPRQQETETFLTVSRIG